MSSVAEEATPRRSTLRRIVPARRSAPLPVVVVVAVAALIVGTVVGRVSAPGGAETVSVAVLEREIVPLSVDADGLWTGGSSNLPAVGEALSDLRRDGTVAPVLEHAIAWRESYDAVVRRMVGVEVPAASRPVQRQFLAAVTLSRDALDLLVAAAEVEDPATRRDLSSEALRLRTRAEQTTQTARASLADLAGRGDNGVAEPDELPSLADLR